MSRTQAADFHDRREVIIETALPLFSERGFVGTSISDLAEACKMSKSLIYHYFNSKEEILFEALDSYVRTLLGATAGIMALEASPQSKLRSLTHALMRLHVDTAYRQKALANELYHLTANQRDIIVVRQARLIHTVGELLCQIQPTLKSQPEMVSPIAMIYFGMLNWTHTWYSPTESVTPEIIADLIGNMALNGIMGGIDRQPVMAASSAVPADEPVRSRKQIK